MHVDGRMLYNMDRNVQLRKRLAFPLRVHESSVPFLDSKSIPLALSHRALHQTGIPSRAPPDQPRTELSMRLLLVLRPRAILLPRTLLHTGSIQQYAGFALLREMVLDKFPGLRGGTICGLSVDEYDAWRANVQGAEILPNLFVVCYW